MTTNAIANVNRVPAKQWKKWTGRARALFNSVYTFMMSNPGLVFHPKQPGLKPEHLKALCWNVAWIAADALDSGLPKM